MREDRLLPYLRVEVCGARPCVGPPRAEASACAALSAAMLRQEIVTARQDAVLILIAELTFASALDFAYLCTWKLRKECNLLEMSLG